MSETTNSKYRAEAQAPARIDAEASTAFLDFLGDSLGVFAFQTYDDDKARNDKALGRTYIGTFDERRRELVTANRDRCAVHVTINDTGRKSRRAANVVRVRKHFVEIDGTHTLEEIKNIAADRGLDIAWINESSPGKYHVYFNVADDLAFDLAGFTHRQKQLVAVFDGGRESVDLSRVLRLPGFYHRKGEPFMVRTLYKDAKAHAHTLADLDMILGDVKSEEREQDQGTVEREEDQAAIDRAIEHFKMFPEAVSDTPNGPMGKKGNNQTYDAMAAARDFGVDENTCLDLALDHYNPRCDPPWEYETLAEIIGNAYRYATGAQGAKHPLAMAQKDFEADPIPESDAEMAERLKRTAERRARKEQQAEPENWDSLQTGWCYIGQQKRYVRKRDGMLWETGAFSDYFANVDFPDKGTNTTPHKWIMNRKKGEFQKFDTFCYLPGKNEYVSGSYNQYVPSAIVALEGDTKLWDEHLKYLFPVPAVRKVVLDWLAWVLQNLDKKPKHALFILGQIQGTGKSFIGDVFAELIGTNNHSPVDQGTFETTHNGWQMRTKLVTCEEVRSLSAPAMRKLHGWITQGKLQINEKNMPHVNIPDVMAYMFFSNKLDAIALDDSDRRYAVAETNVKPRDKPYYCRLYDLLDDPAALAAIKHQLMTRKLGDYSAAGSAPFTDAKLAMIEEGATDLQSFMVSQQSQTPFNYRLVTLNEIVEAIPKQYWPRGGRLLSPVKDVLRRRFDGIVLAEPIQTGARTLDRNRVWAIGPKAAATAKRSWSDLSAIYRAEHKVAKAEADAEAKADFED